MSMPGDIPPAPWSLRGHGVLVLRWLTMREARRHVPQDVRLVPLRPGRSLAAILCCRYAEGSTLRYDELIFSPGLARRSGRLGCWIAGIWVDDQQALAGGRQIWRLQKQYARFEWDARGRAVRVSAAVDGTRLFELQGAVGWRGHLPLPVLGAVLCGTRGDGERFWVRGNARVGAARGTLRAVPTLIRGDTRVDERARFFTLDGLRLTVGAPR